MKCTQGRATLATAVLVSADCEGVNRARQRVRPLKVAGCSRDAGSSLPQVSCRHFAPHWTTPMNSNIADTTSFRKITLENMGIISYWLQKTCPLSIPWPGAEITLRNPLSCTQATMLQAGRGLKNSGISCLLC